MIIKVSAPGKLVLLGEYALLEGAPALVAAIDRYVTVDMVNGIGGRENSVTITHLKTGPILFRPGIFAPGSAKNWKHQADQVRAIFAVLRATGMFSHAHHDTGRTFDLTIDAGPFFSDEGVKFGFGSSAAITVAISGLAASLSHSYPVHPNLLVDQSIQIHRSLQSETGSGIDVAASAMGGILKFQLVDSIENASPSLNRLTPLSGVYIGAVWTGHSASTASFLSGMARFKAGRPNTYRMIMQRLTEVSWKGIAAYQEKRRGRFLEAIDDYSQGLVELSMRSDLPIFSPVHQKLDRIARARGGFYKPSGAGGGDIGLSFTDSTRKRDQMTADFRRAGFQVLDLRWGVNGFSLKERKER
jgi:phosphomevalonate kinase